MYIVCSDLEGVLVPEIWIKIAEKTGIEELRLTTRDMPDYDALMKKRISSLNKNKLKIDDLKKVIATMEPFNGAVEFLDWMRSRTQVIIISDTFVQFSDHLMKKLGRPTLLCNSLSVGSDGSITGYNLRQKDGKRKVLQSLKGLNYSMLAVGDSYNDIPMLQESEKGILFCPPENVKNEYPQFQIVNNYDELKNLLDGFL